MLPSNWAHTSMAKKLAVTDAIHWYAAIFTLKNRLL